MLGLREFDEKVFKKLIRRIHVPAFNRLTYEFMDGTRIEHEWQDKSRDTAWTDEMRRQAAEKARKRWEK